MLFTSLQFLFLISSLFATGSHCTLSLSIGYKGVLERLRSPAVPAFVALVKDWDGINLGIACTQAPKVPLEVDVAVLGGGRGIQCPFHPP